MPLVTDAMLLNSIAGRVSTVYSFHVESFCVSSLIDFLRYGLSGMP